MWTSAFAAGPGMVHVQLNYSLSTGRADACMRNQQLNQTCNLWKSKGCFLLFDSILLDVRSS